MNDEDTHQAYLKELDRKLLVWPEDVRNQFLNSLQNYLRSLSKADGIGLVRHASWKPWTLLSKSQAKWMLGRLAESWVRVGVSTNSVTAWDEGGAAMIWEASFAAASIPENIQYAKEFVPVMRKYLRQTGYVGVPKVFEKGSGMTEIDRDQLQELGELCMEMLFEDSDYLFLEVGNGRTLGKPRGLNCNAMGIRTDYFRCPIPGVVSKKELEWAIAQMV